MLTLKKIDVYGQFATIIFFLVIGAWPVMRSYFLLGYFIVGGWQLLSALIHKINKDRLIPADARTIYHWALMAIAILGLSCLVFKDILIWYLYGLLFFSPLMAVWYLAFSYHELSTWKAKAWVHLK